MSIKININGFVKVKLTERGKEIFRKQFDYLPASYKKRHSPSEFQPKVDSKGYTEIRLNDLMSLYGEYMIPGAPKVFASKTIITQDYEFCRLDDKEENDN